MPGLPRTCPCINFTSPVARRINNHLESAYSYVVFSFLVKFLKTKKTNNINLLLPILLFLQVLVANFVNINIIRLKPFSGKYGNRKLNNYYYVLKVFGIFLQIYKVLNAWGRKMVK